jgi:hypothetical protein
MTGVTGIGAELAGTQGTAGVWSEPDRVGAAGHVLRCADPTRRQAGDLPAVQPAKFELVINLKTAKTEDRQDARSDRRS